MPTDLPSLVRRAQWSEEFAASAREVFKLVGLDVTSIDALGQRFNFVADSLGIRLTQLQGDVAIVSIGWPIIGELQDDTERQIRHRGLQRTFAVLFSIVLVVLGLVPDLSISGDPVVRVPIQVPSGSADLRITLAWPLPAAREAERRRPCVGSRSAGA